MKGPGGVGARVLVDAAVPRVAPKSERWALDDLYRAHAADVARWAGRLAGPELDVEDLVQEVFVVVRPRLAGFRGDAAITTWLFRITLNVVRRERRRARWGRWWTSSEGIDVADERDDPERIAERRQDVVRLYRGLDRLSEKLRTVLILHEIEGLSGDAIAALLDLEVNTVWVRLHRARKRLQSVLEEKR